MLGKLAFDITHCHFVTFKGYKKGYSRNPVERRGEADKKEEKKTDRKLR